MDDVTQELLKMLQEERRRNDELCKLIFQHFGFTEQKVVLPDNVGPQVPIAGRGNWNQIRKHLEKTHSIPAADIASEASRVGLNPEWSEKAKEALRELEEDNAS